MLENLQILQYNARKAREEVMATFLRDQNVLQADIIAIQEPWANKMSETTHQPARMSHQLLYPKERDYGGGRARVCILISRKIDPGSWTQRVISRDYQWLKMIYRRGGEQRTLYIHNVYNKPRSGTIERFNQELRKITCQQQQQEVGKIEHVVVGDFNAHHPAWGGPGVQIETEAERILEIADEHDLILTTEEGIITWERKEQYSTIDLTFISNNLFNRMIYTERADNVQHDSDHWPIRTTIDIQTPPNNPPKRRNWKATDLKILRESLSQNLHVRNLSQATGPRIELELTAFLAAVRRAINDSTPVGRPVCMVQPEF